MRSVLVTGFGPFPDRPANPTSDLVERLAARAPAGVVAKVLPTHYDVCARVAALAARHDLVVMFGVAGRARRMRYERQARLGAGPMCDAAGERGPGPSRSRWTRLDVDALVLAARAAGWPVAPSHSAGTYVCNASYGAALAANPFALFVHVPPTTARGPLSPDGLERHARWLIAALRAGIGTSAPPFSR